MELRMETKPGKESCRQDAPGGKELCQGGAPAGKRGKPLKIAMIGHKRIPSREGGVEIVVDELSTRLVKLGCRVDAYNRYGKHTAGKNSSISGGGDIITASA